MTNDANLNVPSTAATATTKMQSVKLVVLGSESSGKTSLIRQFVFHEFYDQYESTKRKETYYSTVSVNNERLMELKIVDVPTIFEFPTNNEQEWDYGLSSFGLRNADVYLLVFDASSTASFKFMKLLREQILTNRPDSLIIVAGNKHDLVVESTASQQHNGRPNGRQRLTSIQQFHHHHHHKAKLTLTKNSSLTNSQQSRNDSSTIVVGPSTVGGAAIFHRRLTKKFASTVRKQWRNAYVECSAKYNWRVTSVFKELIKIVEQHHAMMTADLTNGGKRKVSVANVNSVRTDSQSERRSCKIQ